MPSDSSAAVERAQQAVLAHARVRSGRRVEPPRTPAPGKASSIAAVERLGVADLADGLQRRGEIARRRRPSTGVCVPICGGARRRLGVGAEVIVEAPGAHLLAQREHLGRVARLGAARVIMLSKRGEPLVERRQLAVIAASVHERRRGGRRACAAGRSTGPPRSHSRLISGSWANADARRRRQAEVDRVAEFVAGETELQADRPVARRALHRCSPRSIAPRETTRARPTASTSRPPSRASDAIDAAPARCRRGAAARGRGSTCRCRWGPVTTCEPARAARRRWRSEPVVGDVRTGCGGDRPGRRAAESRRRR